MVTYTDSAAHGADTVKRAMSLTVMSAVRLTGGYGCDLRVQLPPQLPTPLTAQLVA
jgi:leucyl aminopeptidase (aminopeptidase T)